MTRDTPHPSSPSPDAPARPDRRGFLRASLGSGFAAAALPVAAQTAIKTDSVGLLVGEVTIPVGDFGMPAYRAAPLGRTQAPVVLVVSEIFGVHEYIADVARRLAKAGCFVVSKVPDRQVMGDLDACLTWARGQGADAARAGVTGFCWGGRIVWLYAAHNPAVKAGVAWYGRLAGESGELRPRHPLDVAASLHAPVLGLYGEADPDIPLDQVQRMKAALAAGSPAARRSEFVVYPGAPHAFHADYRSSFRKEAAEDGWRRCLAWFRTHGVA